MRLSAWTATATLVARRSSECARNSSPITCLHLFMVALAGARVLQPDALCQDMRPCPTMCWRWPSRCVGGLSTVPLGTAEPVNDYGLLAALNDGASQNVTPPYGAPCGSSPESSKVAENPSLAQTGRLQPRASTPGLLPARLRAAYRQPAPGSKGLRPSAEPVDGGAHTCLARPLAPAVPGLRAPARGVRGYGHPCHDLPHASPRRPPKLQATARSMTSKTGFKTSTPSLFLNLLQRHNVKIPSLTLLLHPLLPSPIQSIPPCRAVP